MASVLLLIDVQKSLLLPPAPVPGAVAVSAAIEELLGRARASGALVIQVRDNGTDADQDALVHEVLPGEHVVDRTEPDAFAGTGLAALIPVGAELVVAGTRSELGVRATALAALDRGYKVMLVRGAHATYEAAVSRETEAELRAAGVAVAGIEAVRFDQAEAADRAGE